MVRTQKKKPHLFLCSNCSSLWVLVLHNGAGQLLNQSEPPESLLWLNAPSPQFAHHLRNSLWVTSGMNKSLVGNWSLLLGCWEVSNVRMQKAIANSISQVPTDLSDQEMSWLFVFLNIKTLQLRTAFPLSFWLYIAFHTKGGLLQLLRLITVQIINSNIIIKLYMHIEHCKTLIIHSAGQTELYWSRKEGLGCSGGGQTGKRWLKTWACFYYYHVDRRSGTLQQQ